MRIEELEEAMRKAKEGKEETERWCAELQYKRNFERKRADELQSKNEKLEKLITDFEQKMKEGPKREKKDISNTSTFSERVQELARHVARNYNLFDLPRLFVSVLKYFSKKGQPDLRDMIGKCKGFKPALHKIYLERDKQTAKHLREAVFNKEAFALIRLIVNLSKRECGLIQQVSGSRAAPFA